MTELMRIRTNLYKNYVKELSAYDDVLSEFDDDWLPDIGGVIWIDIYDESDIVGFLIIGKNENDCHPDCDYYICQSYVAPGHREKGLMSQTVSAFLSEHHGVYGYDVLKRNVYADTFWKNLFKRLGTIPVNLARIRDKKIEDKIFLYGFSI